MLRNSASLAVMTAALVLTQFSIAQTSGQTGTHPAGQAHVRQEPCWKQVGISESAKEQRDAIASDRRSQVESVCADTSLSPQQKQQKIHKIRQEAKQKIDGVITPEQEQQLQACQKERSPGHPVTGGAHHSGGGPCGEMTSQDKGAGGGESQ
jgi:Spy/CpxP family protein refolding chaperone